MSSEDRFTVAELFCGCGGFSRGFEMTGEFEVVFGNDIKGPALTTFRENHGGASGKPELIKKDIRKLEIRTIEERLRQKDVDELDCLIGGPPCQGFSQLRRSERREDGEIVEFGGYDRLAKDPRNDLVLRFLDIAQALRPRSIIIENVPQLLNHGFNGIPGGLANAIIDILENDMGYRAAVHVLNAADYGVPQLRERAFFLAWRNGDQKPPRPTQTHSDPESLSNLRPWKTVADAILDLPEPPGKKDKLGGGPTSLYRDTSSDYAHMLRSEEAFPYNHTRRHYSDRIIGIIEDMRPGETWDHASERKRREYAKIIKNEQFADESWEDAKERLLAYDRIKEAFYKDYYWSAYSRLAWDEPALTITANSNFLGSGRFTHPEENRGISIREAARLQSFDDDFKFITTEDDTADTERMGVGLDMIGEAVPPLLGKAIAKETAKHLKSQECIHASTN
jgi:DNA-cytosine methyltransferase